ncbi:MAG: Fur family transcriptional regulator [Alphaproteobacteria bacterium]
MKTRGSPIIFSRFGEDGHDHRACVAAALARAGELCARRGARLTKLRRRVLEIVWRSHEPARAYAILDALQGEGYCAAPPTVYRALEFLVAHGLVHRVESLNAYAGCTQPGEAHAGQFLICGRCGGAVELDDDRIRSAIARGAERLGFEIERQTIEVLGLCPVCRPKADGPEGP